MSAVVVKPLEWTYRPWAAAEWCASTNVGLEYFIRERGGQCTWNRRLEPSIQAASIEDAKAAVQADYESRVLSCLAARDQTP